MEASDRTRGIDQMEQGVIPQESQESAESLPASLGRALPTLPVDQRSMAAEPPSRQPAGHSCASCTRDEAAYERPGSRGGITPPYVYALGRIEARFPSLAIEKELAQATGRAETASLTDRQALGTVLSDPQNRYLSRQLCYVLSVQGLETYILQPRDPADFELLIEILGSPPKPSDLHVVIGLRGPVAPPELCNGLMLPMVAFDQIYAFTTDSLVRALPKPAHIEEQPFVSASEEMLQRLTQLTDNAGATDEHRALNYLAVRYPAIYAKSAEAFATGSSLTAIETRPSRLSGVRRILDVIFSYTSRQTDVTEKFFVRVDVTEEFPFLVTKLSPYYDR
ncbi:hypothetical protein [Dactylosporangium sp. NPDC006015]|uniref:cyanobactin maturation protease PatG family protein n=1 Tax=Dactylosporangium sp. NPDC006015 TaxID=3154576 RepID=UPI0033B4E299